MMRPAAARPTGTALGRDGFVKRFPVSRETMARLDAYVALLKSWNRRINLVAPNSLGDVWRRHILDCAQLFPQLPAEARVIVDLGSGAGLPGLVLALLGAPEVHLVEADQRKSAFLREALRVTGTSAVLHPVRSEKMPRLAADAVTARALAPLPELLDIAEPFLVAHSILLFPKGRGVDEELTLAAKGWKMKVRRLPSLTDPSGTILRLESVSREPRRT